MSNICQTYVDLGEEQSRCQAYAKHLFEHVEEGGRTVEMSTTCQTHVKSRLAAKQQVVGNKLNICWSMSPHKSRDVKH
eukprot:15983137-Heterocapsa_arctica.AAC.1